ncbi:MAG: DUF3619 family protein [Gallionella sp.]|nr:MAG: DUF3619 family protein [Gallionella sp.]
MNTNNHPQEIDPEQVARLLTRSAQQLDGNTVAALRRARDIALERQLPGKPVFALSTGRGTHGLMPHSAYQWAATAILLVAVLAGGISYWHHTQEPDISHLDVAILTDDLPLEVFVD